MTDERMFLSALIVREADKPWREADADVVEAIDFCHYYAEEMLRLGPAKKIQEIMGEDNYYSYRPRGLGLVIAPWNFPLAIPCGMTTASLVTGNVTILKPASQTPLIAFQMALILQKAALPPAVSLFSRWKAEVLGQSSLTALISILSASRAQRMWALK